MNERVKKLREQSVQIRPYISTGRAELVTEFYKSDVPLRESVPVCRALAFKHVLEHKTVCINEGELIVGERGFAPKATPTYPELCCHDLEDFRILSTRDKTQFQVSDEARACLPSSWSSGPPATRSSTTRSTIAACATSSRTSPSAAPSSTT
jgi:formate C-acetyltransferase